MSVAVTDQAHPFEAAGSAGRAALQGRRPRPRRVRPQGDPPRRARDARPDGAARAVRQGSKPLAGARIMGSLHMTVQTAVLIETLVRPRRRRALGVVQHLLDAGPRRRRGGRRPAETGGTSPSPQGTPVFAWKGETLEEYWWCTSEALIWPDGGGPDQIVDDGGDATLLVHKGVEFEQAGAVPAFDADERARGVGRHPRAAAPRAGDRPRRAGRASPPASAASARRPPPACTASTR